MKIVNNHIDRSPIPAIKYQTPNDIRESDICPFCEKELYLIKRTNILVCNNPQCPNAIYKLKGE